VECFCDNLSSNDVEDDGGFTFNATIAAISANGSTIILNGTDPKVKNSSRDIKPRIVSGGRRLVPSPEAVARNERIFMPPKHLRRRALAFGSLGRAKLNPEELARLMQIFCKDRYVLIVGENIKSRHDNVDILHRSTVEERIQQSCHIVLHEEATNLDILKSTFSLFLLRRKLVACGRGPRVRSSDCWDLLEEVRSETDYYFPLLLKQLALQGWASPSRFMFGRVQQRAYWPLRGGNNKADVPFPQTSS